MLNSLLKIFKNKTRSFEILYLLNDIKKTVRIDANDIEIKKIKEFCDKENLCMEVSDFKVIKTADEGKGGYSNFVKRVPIKYPYNGLYHIYISKDNNKAKFLKLLENKNDDRAVGELLGYPKCCIDFFMENKEKQQKIQNDYILPALNNSKGFNFSFYTNYVIRYFDITLLSHFPHSFECKDSIRLAKNNLKCINNISKEIANRFEDMLKNPVVYTEKQGIFILKNFVLKDNILEFKDISSTENNELLELLTKNKKIKIIDKNKIKIKDDVLEEIGFILFN